MLLAVGFKGGFAGERVIKVVIFWRQFQVHRLSYIT